MYSPEIIEYKNMRVLTTQQLAKSYGTSTDTITRNFNRNKDRYIEGEHYFALEGDEKNSFLDLGQFDRGLRNAKTLYLWTQKGTLLHAKSLNTDVAWEVYGRLVDNYFSKPVTLDVSQLSPELQMFNQIFTAVAQEQIERKKLSEKVDRIENTQKVITDTFSRETTKDFRPWVKQCITAIVESPNYHYLGTRAEKYQAVTAESYDRLTRKKACRLDQRVQTEKGRAINAGASATRINAINKLTIIESDKALKPIYETVLKEMMIAYCVEASVKGEVQA